MFIEWSGYDGIEIFDKQTDYADCFGAEKDEYVELFGSEGGMVETVLEHKVYDKGGRRVTFVVKKKSTK